MNRHKPITRSFTLLEMLISFSLLALVLGVVFGYWQQAAQLRYKLRAVRREQSQERYLHWRLQQMFSNVVWGKTDKSQIFFLSQEKVDHALPGSLVFIYDSKADLFPKMATERLVRLYLSDQGQLSTAQWPDPERAKESPRPFRQEILMENIQELSFAFYDPPDPQGVDHLDVEAKRFQPLAGEWQTEWPLEWHALPAMVRIKIVDKDQKEHRMNFLLPHVSHMITYE